MKIYDSIIIGGGQAGLSTAYYLRRTDVEFIILDDQIAAGGSWLHTWESLRLFSPVNYSSIPGWQMPKGKDEYPPQSQFVDYLTRYEERYDFNIVRPIIVSDVIEEGELLRVKTDKGDYLSRTVVSATGTAGNPFIPSITNRNVYEGIQIHSRYYKSPKLFVGKKVLVVGGGNSGAQILSEISKIADTKWCTQSEPNFMADDIDGRYLFDSSSKHFFDKQNNKLVPESKESLNNIVMVGSIKEARERNVLHAVRTFERFYENGVVWSDETREEFGAVIWCTGFKANLKHLSNLIEIESDQVKTIGTRSIKEPKLWLVGYGGWTGYASATIYGVQKTARITAKEIEEFISLQYPHSI